MGQLFDWKEEREKVFEGTNLETLWREKNITKPNSNSNDEELKKMMVKIKFQPDLDYIIIIILMRI